MIWCIGSSSIPHLHQFVSFKTIHILFSFISKLTETSRDWKSCRKKPKLKVWGFEWMCAIPLNTGYLWLRWVQAARQSAWGQTEWWRGSHSFSGSNRLFHSTDGSYRAKSIQTVIYNVVSHKIPATNHHAWWFRWPQLIACKEEKPCRLLCQQIYLVQVFYVTWNCCICIVFALTVYIEHSQSHT